MNLNKNKQCTCVLANNLSTLRAGEQEKEKAANRLAYDHAISNSKSYLYNHFVTLALVGFYIEIGLCCFFYFCWFFC